MTKLQAHHVARPASRTSFAAAAAVPPVASTSSTIRTLCPVSMRVAMNFEGVGAVLQVRTRRARSAAAVSSGLRTGTNPALSA